MELTAGSKLGNFTVIKQIGAGGMSEVYLVRDNLDRLFALKTMSSKLSYDPSFRQRFEQEARIMASLSHPNIVQLHSYFEEDGKYCLVMEYVEGQSLKELSRKIGPIPEKRALKILRQMAEALSYAHRRGIIHRDVKPSNILLDANDNVKVMDFGIARMTEGPGLTQTGSQMGTLVYMSPEQIRDSKNVDEKTDVYSLGVSFYEMLTGRPPFDEKNTSDFEIREHIVYKELPDPRNVYPNIGEESLRLLEGFTRKKPEQRLALSQISAGVISEKPEPVPEPATRVETIDKEETAKAPRSQNTLLIGLLAGILMLLLVIGGVIVWNAANKKGRVETIVVEDDSDSKSKPEQASLLEMIHVKGDAYIMGDHNWKQEGDGGDIRVPHEIRVSSFWIGKYEVSQREWMEIMSKNPSQWKGEELPVENVSWHDAVEFCNRLSDYEGLTRCYSGSGNDIVCNWKANGYRLPTEAEWEFAARGGVKSRGFKYSGSNNIDEVAWYDGNSGARTQYVGTRNGNELKIHDMSGNVWEWCWDWYDVFYYKSSEKVDPEGMDIGWERCLRGGSWYYNAGLCEVSFRSYRAPGHRYNNIGFRVCRGSK